MTVGIVLLAMIALFVGLRLYAVLGQRTGHEQRPVTRPEAAPGPEPVAAPAGAANNPAEPSGFAFDQGAAAGIRAIIAADPAFDVSRFLEGAQAAYRMVLEAFWKGDRDELAWLTGDEVRSAFEAAIAEREAAGHKLDNRLVAIERAAIEDARLQGRTAEIDVRFDAFVAAVTRDAEGELIAGDTLHPPAPPEAPTVTWRALRGPATIRSAIPFWHRGTAVLTDQGRLVRLEDDARKRQCILVLMGATADGPTRSAARSTSAMARTRSRRTSFSSAARAGTSTATLPAALSTPARRSTSR